MIKSIVFEVKQTYVLILSLQERNWIELGKSLYLSEPQYALPDSAEVVDINNKRKTVASIWLYLVKSVLLERVSLSRIGKWVMTCQSKVEVTLFHSRFSWD